MERSTADLPEGDVLVRVQYSSLNYKDALSAVGNKGVTRKYPHTPGIDAAGVVEHSRVESIPAGRKVIVTSYDLGMNTSGGFGQYISVPADWVVELPETLTLKESMIFGTAGFTAGLCLYALQNGGINPDSGEILVTGATGGVGSLAVSMLANAGYRVAAVTGKTHQAEFLQNLGAETILTRKEAIDSGTSPLLKPRWAGVIDTVGGEILATAIRTAAPYSVITCCGLVASPVFNITVFPFILRGVSLVGIDSQNYPAAPRQKIWNLLGTGWKPRTLETIAQEITLDDLNDKIDLILKGGITGRVIVKLD